ncbi:MAG TPA: branched-chain amino acid ABC transporter permease [Candidatus Sulfotelmatobacter sp.]|nr:branched-chain amino acid ABC transporter permease [Candidatus Sulfotelmatobacter sp.]
MSAATRREGTMLSAYRFIPKSSVYVLAAIALVAVVVSFTVQDKFYLHLAIMMLFYAAVSSAWNIVGGFAGQLSLGHAAFFGIGAYTSTLLFINRGISPWIGMLVGAALATVVAGAIGYPSFRLRGPFFTLVTIAFAEVLRILTLYFHDFTRGSIGISVPFRPGPGNFIFRQLPAYVYVALAFLIIAVLVSLWIENSRLGYYLAALREDEDAAQALGIDTARYKLVAVLVSAFLTSLGGTFYAQYIFYIEPFQTFSLDFSVLLAMMAIIGGLGTVWGPVAGAFLVTPLQEVLQAKLGGTLQGLHLVIYGAVLIVVVIALPQGIVGSVAGWFARATGERKGELGPPPKGDA